VTVLDGFDIDKREWTGFFDSNVTTKDIVYVLREFYGKEYENQENNNLGEVYKNYFVDFGESEKF